MISIRKLPYYGSYIDPRMFGGNILFDKDRLGDGTYDDAVEHLELKSIRYPGGTISEQFFDISKPDNTRTSHPVSGADVDLLPLSEFLKYAADRQLVVDIVVPTRFALAEGDLGQRDVDPNALSKLSIFINDILSGKYGQAEIGIFEIGNEYWLGGEMTAEEYGRVASSFAQVIHSAIGGMRGSKTSDWNEPSVGVQIGQYGKFDQRPGWVQNQIILDEFDANEADAVDGIIGHYYVAGGPEEIQRTDWFFDRMRSWEQHPLFDGVEFYATEWNTEHFSTSQFGLLHSSMILHMHSEMVVQGIDAASVWPVQQNINNDLFGREADLSSTFAGEMFRILSQATSGGYLVGRSVENHSAVYHYNMDQKNVVFLVNQTETSQRFSLDLNGILDAGDYVWTQVLGATGPADSLASVPKISIESNILVPNKVFNTELESHEILSINILDSTLGVKIEGKNNFSRAFQAELDDELIGTQNYDFLSGYDGDDWVDGRSGRDFLTGGIGNDTILGGIGNDTLHGDDNEDSIDGGSGKDTVTGGRGDDTVLGGAGKDEVWGWLGLDFLNGGAGNDILIGEEDSDTLDGWYGDDSLYGGQGWDSLIGGDGDDLLNGDGQNDTLWGGDGNDTLAGGHDDDLLFGERDHDALYGWLGNDILEGGVGDDTLYGEEDNDVVSGGEDNDLLSGGEGNDTLWGFVGHDTLEGGEGDDELRGEEGNDVFIFTDWFGNDTIFGFETSNDAEKIDLSDLSSVNSFSDLALTLMFQDDTDVLIDTGKGSIRLLETALGELDAGDFVL